MDMTLKINRSEGNQKETSKQINNHVVSTHSGSLCRNGKEGP